MKKYDPSQIEPKWQQIWADNNMYQAVDGDKSDEKYYVLVEFPYPSGDGLHVGHVRSFTAQDVVARRLRMMGHNVMYPMGWDAFGLPTENFAIKNKIKPQVATASNIANFKRQMQSLGLSFDWSREINTTDPQYYRWTQWIFLQLLKEGLAYQKEIAINWCPHCKTGLANEEVVNGCHERCDTPVEKRLLKQWLLKITAYADRLIEDLKTVDYLPQVATQQINWIGKSYGAKINFAIDGHSEKIEVFTTRPDTLFGATFIVLAPEHPLVEVVTTEAQTESVARYVQKAKSRSNVDRMEEATKTGVFTGAYAVNPATKENIPIWVADYVLMDYGTGAIMCVPAHDQRDFEFAQKFGLPIRNVINPVAVRDDAKDKKTDLTKSKIVAVVTNDDGEMLTINWGPKMGGRLFVGGTAEDSESPQQTALREVAEETGYTDLSVIAVGDETFFYKYFAFSKQETHEIDTKFVLLKLKSDAQVEQKLDDSENGKFTVEWVSRDQAVKEVVEPLHKYALDKFVLDVVHAGDGMLTNSGKFDGMSAEAGKKAIIEWLAKKGIGEQQVQYKLRDWIFSRQHYWGEPIPVIHCEQCGVVPVPEDQLPVELPDVEAYEPTDTGESPLANITDWVNVDCPSCGGKARRETDTMPNWAGSSWYYLRYIDPHNDQALADPNKLKYWLMVDLYNGGMEHTTLHLLYSRFWHKFLYDQGVVPTPEPYARRRSHGMVLAHDGVKMSKSKGNVVNPDDVVAKFGADALRVYELFMGPYDQAIDWSDDKLAGIYRFLNRVWDLQQTILSTNESGGTGSAEDGIFVTEVDQMVHKTIKKVDERLARRDFNTMVSALMELVNFLTTEEVKNKLANPRFKDLAERTMRALSLMLAPSAPHIAEELWEQLGNTESVHLQTWPKYDPGLVKDDTMTIIVQVNGKLRGEFVVEAGTSHDDIEREAKIKNDELNWTGDTEIVKTVVVPGKLVNFVTK